MISGKDLGIKNTSFLGFNLKHCIESKNYEFLKGQSVKEFIKGDEI
jgi:hypothetical protein